MLVLTRRKNEKIIIGNNIILKLLDIKSNKIIVEITRKLFIFSFTQTKELFLKSFCKDVLKIKKNVLITFLKYDAYRASMQASLGIEAPPDIPVHRLEIYQRIKQKGRKSA